MSGAPPLAGDVAPDWADALEPVASTLAALEGFLDAEDEAGRGHLPARLQVMRAFEQPMSDVRVLVVGQDPYPTPGHAVGLSFAVDPRVRPVPRSLHNIFTELGSDLGLPRPESGDLTPWAEQGVLLLNRVLTVEPGRAASHRRRGWEQVTDQAIRALVDRGAPLVALLWGRDAYAVVPLLATTPHVASAHPSPLSAARGFFGSRPFSRVNEALMAQGAAPVDWNLTR